jgi:hypothetical protein
MLQPHIKQEILSRFTLQNLFQEPIIMLQGRNVTFLCLFFPCYFFHKLSLPYHFQLNIFNTYIGLWKTIMIPFMVTLM